MFQRHFVWMPLDVRMVFEIEFYHTSVSE